MIDGQQTQMDQQFQAMQAANFMQMAQMAQMFSSMAMLQKGGIAGMVPQQPAPTKPPLGSPAPPPQELQSVEAMREYHKAMIEYHKSMFEFYDKEAKKKFHKEKPHPQNNGGRNDSYQGSKRKLRLPPRRQNQHNQQQRNSQRYPNPQVGQPPIKPINDRRELPQARPNPTQPMRRPLEANPKAVEPKRKNHPPPQKEPEAKKADLGNQATAAEKTQKDESKKKDDGGAVKIGHSMIRKKRSPNTLTKMFYLEDLKGDLITKYSHEDHREVLRGYLFKKWDPKEDPSYVPEPIKQKKKIPFYIHRDAHDQLDQAGKFYYVKKNPNGGDIRDKIFYCDSESESEVPKEMIKRRVRLKTFSAVIPIETLALELEKIGPVDEILIFSKKAKDTNKGRKRLAKAKKNAEAEAEADRNQLEGGQSQQIGQPILGGEIKQPAMFQGAHPYMVSTFNDMFPLPGQQPIHQKSPAKPAQAPREIREPEHRSAIVTFTFARDKVRALAREFIDFSIREQTGFKSYKVRMHTYYSLHNILIWRDEKKIHKVIKIMMKSASSDLKPTFAEYFRFKNRYKINERNTLWSSNISFRWGPWGLHEEENLLLKRICEDDGIEDGLTRKEMKMAEKIVAKMGFSEMDEIKQMQRMPPQEKDHGKKEDQKMVKDSGEKKKEETDKALVEKTE